MNKTFNFAVLDSLRDSKGMARRLEGAHAGGGRVADWVDRALSQRPLGELAALLRSPGAGGITARGILPFAVLVPLVTGWVWMVGERLRFYDLPVGLAFMALTNAVVLGSTVVWTTAGLRRIDRARDRTERTLRQSEERFRLVAESLPEVVSVVRSDGSIEYINPYFYRFTGQTAEEAAGDGWASTLHPEDAARSLRAWKSALETGEGYELEQRMRRTDGVFRWHHLRVLPVLDAEGHTVKWVSTATDVDEWRRTSLTLQRFSEQLERSNRELESFAYVASHDLQEPLRTLSGFSELLLERHREKLASASLSLLASIRDGAARMHLLIQNLLAYSRVETRGEPFRRIASDELLRQALADLAGPLAETGARVTHDPLPEVWGDQRQLNQLFVSLLDKTLRHHPEETPVIHVSAQREERAWRFSVRANGSGIAEEELEGLFLGIKGSYDLGVGLTHCRRIVARHGGRIWLESRPGEGSSCFFTLAIPEESSR